MKREEEGIKMGFELQNSSKGRIILPIKKCETVAKVWVRMGRNRKPHALLVGT